LTIVDDENESMSFAGDSVLIVPQSTETIAISASSTVRRRVCSSTAADC